MAETLTALLAELIRDRPDATALVDGDDRPGFAELDERARRVAGALADAGVAAGDRVAIWLPNCAAWLELELALARLGAIAVAVNTKFRAHEVADILERSDASVLALWPGFKDIDFAGILERVERERLAGLGSSSPSAAPRPTSTAAACCATRRCATTRRCTPTAPPPTRRATSSPPRARRGCPSSSSTTRPGSSPTRPPSPAPSATASPGRSCWRCCRCAASSASTPLSGRSPAGRRPRAGGVRREPRRELVERQRVTHPTAPTQMLARILDAAGDGGRSPPARGRLRRLQRRAARGRRRRDALGKAFYQAYGSSEVQALMAHAPAGGAARASGRWRADSRSAAIDVRVAHAEDGSLQPRAKDGELEVRGPNVMAGYLGDRDAEARRSPTTADVRTRRPRRLAAPGASPTSPATATSCASAASSSARARSRRSSRVSTGSRPRRSSASRSGEPRPVAFVVGDGLDEDAVIAACRSELGPLQGALPGPRRRRLPDRRQRQRQRVQRGELRRRAGAGRRRRLNRGRPAGAPRSPLIVVWAALDAGTARARRGLRPSTLRAARAPDRPHASAPGEDKPREREDHPWLLLQSPIGLRSPAVRSSKSWRPAEGAS